ncbi:MAG: nuclear transport factor 2 family protein [Pseudonocardia sp.]
MSEQHTPAAVATAFVEAFGRGDLRTVGGLLAGDVTFESPRVTLAGAEPVLAAIGEFTQVVTGVTIRSVLGDDERAMIMYDMHTAPFGTLRAVDHLVVRDGRIASDTLVFDTYEVRRATETG